MLDFIAFLVTTVIVAGVWVFYSKRKWPGIFNLWHELFVGVMLGALWAVGPTIMIAVVENW